MPGEQRVDSSRASVLPNAPRATPAKLLQELRNQYRTEGNIKLQLGRVLEGSEAPSFSIPYDEIFLHTLLQLKKSFHAKLKRRYNDAPQTVGMRIALSPSLCNLIFGSSR